MLENIRSRRRDVTGWLRAALGTAALRDLALLAVFFSGVHGLLLLDYAARWDGWVIYYAVQDREWPRFLAWGRELGVPPFAYLHYLVGQLPSFVFWFKFITFTSHLTATLVTYHLLGDFPSLGRADRLLLCMLIATFPASLVNLELIMMPFAVCYACFFIATAAYRHSVRSAGAARLLTRLAALGLFYFSFMMQSLLVLYAAFLVYAMLAWPGNAERPSARLKLFLQRHGDFIVLPVVYWVVKVIWFRPFGYYAGHNAFDLNLLSLLASSVLALYGGLFVPLARGVQAIRQLPAVALVVLAALLLLRPLWVSARWEKQGQLFAVGCGLVCLGLLPYVAVGKYPNLQDLWSSRFAYLVPIGAGFLVYGGLKWYLAFLGASRYFGMAAVSLVIAGFTTANISNYFTFGIDALKQEATVLHFRDQKDIATAATVVVEDSAEWLSAYERRIRFYEYNGMLRRAFGDERRLGIQDRQYRDQAYMTVVRGFYGQPRWLLADYDGRGPLVRVRIQSNGANWNLRKLYLMAVYLRLRGRTKERDALLRPLLSVQVLPPQGP